MISVVAAILAISANHTALWQVNNLKNHTPFFFKVTFNSQLIRCYYQGHFLQAGGKVSYNITDRSIREVEQSDGSKPTNSTLLVQ